MRVNGLVVKMIRNPYECIGCRLNGKRAPARRKVRSLRESTKPALEFYGQLIYSDHAIKFPPSWQHRLTCALNFCNGYTQERSFYFTVFKSSKEVASCLRHYIGTNSYNSDRLRHGKIYAWKVDNAKE